MPPFFENKEVDPRDCSYRANIKIRKQIEKAIRADKIKYGLIPSRRAEDEASTGKPSSTKATVKNRFKKSETTKKDVLEENKENNKEEEEEDLLKADFGKERMIAFLEQLEELMFQEDEHKQAFSYDDLVKMHQLLQYLEEDAEKDGAEKKASTKGSPASSFRSQYFFQFMEDNFKVIQPEKRKNAELDERLRKLKYKAASSDYDAMTANISRAFRSSGGKSGSGATGDFSQELRNIRSTLIATANAFMVIVATFAFFYIAFGYARPDTTTASKVLFSFSASMVVAVAEVYFLIRII